jgi:selenoprotein W-related protein
MPEKPKVEIVYCTGCRWLLRAAWMSQELLSTFENDLGGVTLVPGGGGVFDIRLDGTLIWSREKQGGFPDIKILKQLVRDHAAPGRHLGHSDSQQGKPGTGGTDRLSR